jgi:hypothetical protein
MSSAVVSTSAARGRPFVFDADADPEVGEPSKARIGTADPSTGSVQGTSSAHALSCPVEQSSTSSESVIARVFQSAINNPQSKIPPSSITPASRLEIRPAPEMVSSGILALDTLTGGLPRGCLTEICGPASSGRTTMLLAALAAATRRGEFCAVVDASDALDPHSVIAAEVELDRLLWVRCGANSSQRHRGTEKNSKVNSKDRIPSRRIDLSERCLEQVLRATDLLLESGGFGLIVLDLAHLPPQAARRIPLTTWFRFRRAIEYTATILLAIEERSIAGSCSSLLLQLRPQVSEIEFVEPSHAHLLTGLNINAELVRSRLDRKPVCSTSMAFASKTAWAG